MNFGGILKSFTVGTRIPFTGGTLRCRSGSPLRPRAHKERWGPSCSLCSPTWRTHVAPGPPGSARSGTMAGPGSGRPLEALGSPGTWAGGRPPLVLTGLRELSLSVGSRPVQSCPGPSEAPRWPRPSITPLPLSRWRSGALVPVWNPSSVARRPFARWRQRAALACLVQGPSGLVHPPRPPPSWVA